MNKRFQDKLLKLVSIDNSGAVFRSINVKALGPYRPRDPDVSGTHQRDKFLFNIFFQFSKYSVCVDIHVYFLR